MRRAGFTLIELTAALALTGLALAGSWGLLSQVAVGRDRTIASAADADRRANGARLLRALVFSAEAGAHADERFSGTPSGARFVTWCDAPGGWRVRCQLALDVTAAAPDSSTLTATMGARAPLTLLRSRGPLALRYADRAANGTVLLERWTDGITPPDAIALIGERDTVILAIGIRGAVR